MTGDVAGKAPVRARFRHGCDAGMFIDPLGKISNVAREVGRIMAGRETSLERAVQRGTSRSPSPLVQEQTLNEILERLTTSERRHARIAMDVGRDTDVKRCRLGQFCLYVHDNIVARNCVKMLGPGVFRLVPRTLSLPRLVQPFHERLDIQRRLFLPAHE
jgi:hypothetical protein